MSKPCCGRAPPVFIGNDSMPYCSECESKLESPKRDGHIDPFDEYDWIGSLPMGKSIPECSCGAEKIFGKNPPGHYPDCVLVKK